MTNTKAILGISFAAVFAVAMIFAPNAVADGDFKSVLDTEITRNGNTVDITFTAGADIPTDGSEGAFGYGFITGTNDDNLPENVLALTTHKCVSDSFEQGDSADCGDTVAGLLEALGLGTNEEHDDETFHAHILDLKSIEAGSNCIDVENNIGLEVDLSRTLQTQNNVSPDYDVDVNGDEITVSDVKIGDLHSANFKNSASVGFGITGFADENANITNLCLTT